ncbi:hypothetical protein ACXWR7_12670, partial [Streptococcus pyogenes]
FSSPLLFPSLSFSPSPPPSSLLSFPSPSLPFFSLFLLSLSFSLPSSLSLFSFPSSLPLPFFFFSPFFFPLSPLPFLLPS